MTSFIMGDGRTHVKSGLMRESLVSTALNEETDQGNIRRMLPDVTVISIGGQSIMDRGAEALFPLVDMIVTLRKQHKLVIGVGGGIRVRHTSAIALDLGLPIGGVARILGGVQQQNRDIMQFLLAPHGGVNLIKDNVQDLPMFLNGGLIPICIGQPPYHFWEPPPTDGRLPDNGSDVGIFLMAEALGAARMVYLKDVEGLYTANPKNDPNAELITEISAKELIDMNLPELPFERELLRCLENSRLLTECYLINGLEPESLRKLLEGEHVGSKITGSNYGANA